MPLHTLKLIKGDKFQPTTEVNLANPTNGVTVAAAGFTPVSGDKDFVWSGRSTRFDGQQLITTSRDNAEFELEYNLQATSGGNVHNTLMTLQKSISEILQDAEAYELDRTGEPVYIEYGWGTGNITSVPVIGQLNTYCRVKGYDIEWPSSLMSEALVGGVIERIRITLYCEPYAEGLRRQIATSPFALSGPHTAPFANYWVDDKYTFACTLTVPNPLVDFWIFQVYESATQVLFCFYDAGFSTINWNYNNSAGTSNAVSKTITALTAGQTFDFVGTHDLATTTTKFYIDGVSTEVSSSFDFNLSDFGTNPSIRFGTATGETTGSPHTIPDNADADSVGAIFAISGYDVFTDGPFTQDHPEAVLSNNPIENDDGNNYIYVTGVPGDIPALTEWQISPPTSNPANAYWIGIKAVEGTLTDPGMFWLEFQGTVVAGASGGEVERIASLVVGTHEKTITDDIDKWAGRYEVLAHVETDKDCDFTPFYRFGTNTAADVYGPTESRLSNTSTLKLRDLGEIYVKWFGSYASHQPTQIVVGIESDPVTGFGTVTRDIDYAMLMPHPFLRVGSAGNSITIASGDKVVVIGNEAWIMESDNDTKNALEVRGEAHLVPGKTNYIYLIQGEEGQDIDVSDTATLTIFITPRYQLPGFAMY